MPIQPIQIPVAIPDIQSDHPSSPPVAASFAIFWRTAIASVEQQQQQATDRGRTAS